MTGREMIAREPAGTAQGGQFASTGRSEVDNHVTMTSMSSIFFPERQETAEDHMQWWSQVPVPDQVLQRIVDDYENCRALTINNIVGKFKPPERDPSWSHAEWQGRHNEAATAYNDNLQHWKDYLPEEPDRFGLRDAVRIHLANTYRYTLPEDEAERFGQMTMRAGSVSGDPSAVSTYYCLPGFVARHPDAFTKVPDQNSAVRAELRKLREELSGQVAYSARHTEMLLRDALVMQGYTPEQLEQIVAGEPMTGKKLSVRQAHKVWRKQIRKGEI